MDNTIYYNIEQSKYFVDYNKFRFYFSSQFYKEKFENNYQEFIENENYKLQARFNIDLDFKDMLLFYYYMRVEKRGFNVQINNNNNWADIKDYNFKALIDVTS